MKLTINKKQFERLKYEAMLLKKSLEETYHQMPGYFYELKDNEEEIKEKESQKKKNLEEEMRKKISTYDDDFYD